MPLQCSYDKKRASWPTIPAQTKPAYSLRLARISPTRICSDSYLLPRIYIRYNPVNLMDCSI